MEVSELIEKYQAGERDFSWADLCGANLSRASLCGANLSWANLCSARLSRANLSRARLSRANFCGADLCGANLNGTDLSGADLCGADLCGANLCRASLSRANLCGANLCGARGNGREICSAQIGKYDLIWTAENLWIGCQSAPLNVWWNRTPEDIEQIEQGAGALWTKHRDFIWQMVDQFPATPTNGKAPKKA